MPDYADWHAKLLATANHPNTGPEEAEACRAKAAEILKKHGPFDVDYVSAYPRNLADDIVRDFWSDVYKVWQSSPFTEETFKAESNARYGKNGTYVGYGPADPYAHDEKWRDWERTPSNTATWEDEDYGYEY
jgi:hypothetical protein